MKHCHNEQDFEVDDEDVELQNSPLYHYMQECENYLKDECVKSSSSDMLSIFKEKFDKFKCQISCLAFSRMFHFARKIIGYGQDAYSMNESFRVKHQIVLKESQTLLEDDANFLENVIADETKGVDFDMKEIYLNKLVFAPVLLGCWQVYDILLPNTIYSSALLTVCTCAVSHWVISTLRLLRRKNILTKSLKTTNEIVSNCEKLLKCCNKCLTYIRELDVYGKGILLPVPEFSLSRVENSSLFVTSSVALPKMCAVMPLRISLFNVLKNQIKIFRGAIFSLQQLQLDNDQNYVAYLNNNEIKSLLNKEVLDSKEIACIELKGLHQLLHLHMSEFLRRLCLCFCNSIRSTSTKSLEPFHMGDKVLLCLNKEIESDLMQLNEDYKIHHYISSPWNKEIKPKKWRNFKQQTTSLQAVYSSVRSLSLHLTAALARIHEVSENITENEETQYDMVLSQLQLIRQDMQGGQFCVDESFARLLKLKGYVQPTNDELPASPNLPVATNSDSVPVIPPTEKVDIASEDQVFEAYINNDDIREDGTEYYEVDTVAEKQREISRHLFAELKTVLVPKAKEWKVREAKALGIREQELSSMQDCKDQEDDKEHEELPNEDNNEGSNSTVLNVQPFHWSYADAQESGPLPNNMFAAAATLAARRAKSFLKPDECFEYDLTQSENSDSDNET